MTQTLRTSLVIDGDASSSNRAIRDWRAAVKSMDADIKRVEASTKSASASASVFERALKDDKQAVDQLRASMDPLFAATQRLEQSTELLTNAQRSGAISARQAEQMQSLLAQQHRQATLAIQQQAVATRNLRFMTAGGAGGMQNFSFQLQDVFTQIGMGVPLMISLGQQAPQLLSGFGTVGAVLGVAAAAVFPLTAAIFGLGYQGRQTQAEMQTASDLIVEALNAIGDAQTTLQENSLTNLDAITAKYGEVTRGVLRLMKAQNDLALESATQKLSEGLEAAIGTLDDTGIIEAVRQRMELAAQLREELAALESQPLGNIGTSLGIQQQMAVLRRELEGALDLSEILGGAEIDAALIPQIEVLKEQIQTAFNAEDFDLLLSKFEEMHVVLRDIPDGPLRDMFVSIVEGEDALRQMLATAEDNEDVQRRIQQLLNKIGTTDVSSNLAAAAAQASRIADELGRAVSNASALANQGVGEVRRAEINYQFRDNPIGRAQALAEAEFDSRTATSGPVPDGAARLINQEREAFVGARVEAAEYTEQLKEWQEAQREAASASARAARSGASAGRREAREALRERERTITDIRRQMDQLAPSYARDTAALQEWRAEALANLNPAAAGFEAFASDVETIFEERLAEAYRNDLERRSDWAAGLERGMLNIQDGMTTFADASQSILENWAKAGEEQFLSLAKTGKASVSDLVDFALDQFLRLAYQQAVAPGLNNLFSIGLNALGSALGGIGPGAGVTAVQSHAGSEIGTAGVRRSYGPNAPLRADERLTVTKLGQRVFTPEQIANGSTVVNALAMAAQANQGGAGSVIFAPEIKVENLSSAQISAEVREEDNGRGGRRYTIQLADEVGRAMNQRGGGADKALRARGARPGGALR